MAHTHELYDMCPWAYRACVCLRVLWLLKTDAPPGSETQVRRADKVQKSSFYQNLYFMMAMKKAKRIEYRVLQEASQPSVKILNERQRELRSEIPSVPLPSLKYSLVYGSKVLHNSMRQPMLIV